MYKTKIGHAHLKVRDLPRAIRFYQQFLHLDVVEVVGDHYAFLSSGPLHHEIALQNVGPDAPGPARGAIGLYHIAFEVPDRESLAQAYQALLGAGVPVEAVDHFISWALYFRDPDDNGLEIYWDTRKQPHGRERWFGQSISLTEERLFQKD